MANVAPFGDLATAFAIGLLIGLSREQSLKGPRAGRVLLAPPGCLARAREVGGPGFATPVAVSLTFLHGAMVLASKEPLHAFARNLAPEIRGMRSFLVVALVWGLP